MTKVNDTTRRFVMDCWTVVLPKAWIAKIEKQGASFTRTPARGALQISCAVKEHEQVTDADLLEFAADKKVPETNFQQAHHPRFRGLERTYVKDGYRYQEWWLRESHLLVFATYVVDLTLDGEDEQREVQQIVTSLEPGLPKKGK